MIDKNYGLSKLCCDWKTLIAKWKCLSSAILDIEIYSTLCVSYNNVIKTISYLILTISINLSRTVYSVKIYLYASDEYYITIILYYIRVSYILCKSIHINNFQW